MGPPGWEAFERGELSVHEAGVESPEAMRERLYAGRQERLHLFGGALYGLSPAADPRAQFPHKTPIAGLFQAGQTTYPGYGVGTAATSGVVAAKALMKTVHR
jgi:phytoene dehydrogenase-like protein